MNKKFNEILEKDEVVIKVLQPDLKRLFLSPLIIPMVLTLFLAVLYYKNMYFAYTNKRLIVRKGFLGNSYHSLQYKDITSTSIIVGLFDKLNKTGTLLFVNPSSHHEHPMLFCYIKNPYQEMTAIKEAINSFN